MHLRSIAKYYSNTARPPAMLPARYTAFALIMTLSACAVAQPEYGYTAQFERGAVRGFQIQVFSTQDQHAADAWVEDANAWWESLAETQQRALFGVAYLPIEVKKQSPNYKIRIGHFRSREEARVVLEKLAPQFPAAFIVPDMRVSG